MWTQGVAPRVILAVMIFLIITPASMSGQDDAEIETSTVGDLASKFTVHGFFSLGYGDTDHHQYRGVPDSSTVDLHNAAIQVRFLPNEENELVLQLTNESVGRATPMPSATTWKWTGFTIATRFQS